MLLTKANRKALAPYGSEAKLAVVKFFTPDGNWTWYASEFDGEDTFFGLVDGHVRELGSFSLSELKSVRGRFGLPIERDRHFTPTPLTELLGREYDRWGEGDIFVSTTPRDFSHEVGRRLESSEYTRTRTGRES